ncbi:MAG: hypothetical protein UY00_C0018G0001 [Candidatus Wolfebacteria bacterium GW2011_GWA1_47_6]|nr:MAG: hypothetical protein UY00_C0018G0001 [Candidatus Wolfebacteria bacterium GW2011_GWA1_47_6]
MKRFFAQKWFILCSAAASFKTRRTTQKRSDHWRMILVAINLMAWGVVLSNFIPPISPEVIASRESARCGQCHSYLVTADQKFSAAYPEFKPIAPWTTENYPPVVLHMVLNPWYRTYAKGTFELGGRRYDAIVKIIPLCDGRVSVVTNDPLQNIIAILP